MLNNDKTVYIVGGGYSLRDKNLRGLEHKNTIVINKAISFVPNPTYFLTMDFTFLSKMGNKFKSHFKSMNFPKIFIVNFASGHLIEHNGQIMDKRWKLIYKLNGFNIIIKSKNAEGIGNHLGDFRNGDNSGYSALQLAILLGYTDIRLLGIDLVVDKKTHFHGGYGEAPIRFQKKLDEYYKSFKSCILELKEMKPEVKIYSCSKISKLNDIIPYRKIYE